MFAKDLCAFFSLSTCRVMYLLGYIPKDNRLYLGDKELNVVSYSLLLSVLEYQTAVMRRDFETADKVCSILCFAKYLVEGKSYN